MHEWCKTHYAAKKCGILAAHEFGVRYLSCVRCSDLAQVHFDDAACPYQPHHGPGATWVQGLAPLEVAAAEVHRPIAKLDLNQETADAFQLPVR